MIAIRNVLFLYSALLILSTVVNARHIHRPLKHKHARQVVSTTSSQLPTVTAAEDAVVQDMAEVEQGLAELPADLYDFLESAGQELEQDEDVLSALINPSGAAETSLTPVTIPPPFIPVPTTAATSQTPSFPTPIPLLSTASVGEPIVISLTFLSTSTVMATSVLEESGAYPTAPPFPMYPLNGTSIQPPSSTGSLEAGLVPSNQSATTFEPNITSSPTNVPTASTAPSDDTNGSFNATSSSNVAVYWGQGPDVEVGDLFNLCTNPNVDIIILAFVSSLFSPSGMPSASFGPGCTGSTPAQQLSAPGLSDCSSIAPILTGCQSAGKKILISIGGYGNNVSIPTTAAGAQAASNLWSLFGAGTSLSSSLRPFGPSFIADGFDLDNETKDPSNYYALAAALRSQFLTDTNKTYYLSAAPQCPYPDASIPVAAMALADFVYVQFYNNPPCNLDSDGFQDAFETWAAELADVSNFTRLYIGAAAWEGAGSGYVVGSGLETRISLARELGVANFGGIMLWTGTQALSNVDGYGDDYLVYAKGSLE